MNRALRILSRLQALIGLALLALVGGAWGALAPGDHEFVLKHDGLQRSYVVHVPPQAAGGQSLPVVINFHGAGANARIQQQYSRMNETAARHGFIVVYPNGSGGFGQRFLTWNAGACCGPAAARQVDDVGFVLALIDDLARRTPIDRGRLFATGLSNGAMMAYRLAAEAAGHVAAVAGVAGTMSVADFRPARAVAVLHIHSVDDRIALYAGGLAPALPGIDTRALHEPVASLVQRWSDHNHCPREGLLTARVQGEQGTPDAGHRAARYVHAPCRDGTEVVHWQLSGAGHVWPGGVRDYLPLLIGPGTAVIDANEEMWRFFARFRRERN